MTLFKHIYFLKRSVRQMFSIFSLSIIYSLKIIITTLVFIKNALKSKKKNFFFALYYNHHDSILLKICSKNILLRQKKNELTMISSDHYLEYK